jgi:hypothetical protein
LAAGRAALGQSPECGALTLTERAAYPLPSPFGVSGAVSDPATGDLLVWFADQSALRLTGSGETIPLALPSEVTVTALAPGPEPGGVTILDAVAGAVLRLDGNGRLVARDSLQRFEGEVIDAAVFVGGRWVTGSRDALGRRYVLRRLEPGGGTILYATQPARSLAGIPRFRLTADGSAVLLAELMAPFRVHRVPLDPGPARDYEPVLAGSRTDLVADTALAVWRSLAVLALDCGAIQTLADLSSLSRLLVRYDGAGRVARVARVEAPFGLMLSRPEERMLVGARRTGAEGSALELVFYQWRWVRESNLSSPHSFEEPSQ